MTHQNKDLAALLPMIDLGSSVAESDTLLETARIETSAFSDLLNDRVDLVPGTKGSGKSALFRIFVEFLPRFLLEQRKVVIAHGIQAPGDPVFHAFLDSFSGLSEEEFVSFWCIYLVSLAHEHFIKGPKYQDFLQGADDEIARFRRACEAGKIPEIKARKTLRDVLGWTLHALAIWRPKIKYSLPQDGGDVELSLFESAKMGTTPKPEEKSREALPRYINEIKESLEAVLGASNLSLWLMIDRLDEIFPRRSDVERTALRGLLRAMRFFTSSNIRVKVFLRDDMLEQVVKTEEGFTALTHVTARKADTLRWTEDQILAMVVKRFFANEELVNYLNVDTEQLEASSSYRAQCFAMIFPPTAFGETRKKQSPTIRWICNHCSDGRGVLTPRDVLDLLLRAVQKQQDICAADLEGNAEWIISPSAIQYGFAELSNRKRETYLEAEFPHLWADIKKFSEGKTSYNEKSLYGLLGSRWRNITENLLAIGFFSKGQKAGEDVYSIPFLYRHGMNLTQGSA